MQPHVIRFNLAATGITGHAHPLTVRVDLKKNVGADQLRGQGERLAEHLAAALPSATVFALIEALSRKVRAKRPIVFSAFTEGECIAFLNRSPSRDLIIERDILSGRFNVLDVS